MGRLDADRRNQTRHRPEGVAPLELWDLEVGGATLFEARAAADFPARVAAAIVQLQRGTARRRSGEAIDERARAIDFVFVGGGGGARRGMVEAIAEAGVPFAIGSDGAFVGEAGGRALVGGAGLIVDLGQSAIKVSWPGGRLRAPRDFSWLPPDGAPEPSRARLRQFAAHAIRRAGGNFVAVVLALPSAIDDELCPGESSYAGMAGDRALVGDLLERSGLGDATVLVINDAELAAVSARAQGPRGATALVLTIGFGVGGALVLP